MGRARTISCLSRDLWTYISACVHVSLCSQPSPTHFCRLRGVWPHFTLLWVCGLTYMYRESREETADGDSVPTLQGALLKAKAHTLKLEWVSNVHV